MFLLPFSLAALSVKIKFVSEGFLNTTWNYISVSLVLRVIEIVIFCLNAFYLKQQTKKELLCPRKGYLSTANMKLLLIRPNPLTSIPFSMQNGKKRNLIPALFHAGQARKHTSSKTEMINSTMSQSALLKPHPYPWACKKYPSQNPGNIRFHIFRVF